MIPKQNSLIFHRSLTRITVMIAFQRIMEHFQLIVNGSCFLCDCFDWIEWFIAITNALVLITFHFVEQRRMSRWILHRSLQKERIESEQKFRSKIGACGGWWYSLVSHTVHCFPLALGPSAVSLTVNETKIGNFWVKIGNFNWRESYLSWENDVTTNFDSCSLVCRSSVCIRSSASSNDVNIVSFSMTVVCSRLSSSFFAFVMIFSSSLRLSKPLIWFCEIRSEKRIFFNFNFNVSRIVLSLRCRSHL